MVKVIMNIVFGTFLLFVFVFLWVRWQERISVFAPARDLYRTPAEDGVTFEDIHLSSAGNELHGWFLPGPGHQIVLWMHGNAGNIADRLDQAMEMNQTLGVSSLMFDYRGYGRSKGRPTEKGLYEDAEAALEWLKNEKGYSIDDIILYGHSLGTAVAVDLALGKGAGAGGLVLESPFTSAADLARKIYFGLPVGLLMSVELDNKGRIGEVRMPVLIIHGESDSVIPFKMGKKVFEAAPEPKSFLAVPGGDHSDCYVVGGAEYWKAWRDFLQESGVRSQNPE